MGTRGLEIVRFRKRYYIRYHQYDTFFKSLGAGLVARIPSNPEQYQEWLKSMRAEYADRERDLEEHVHEIRDGSELDVGFIGGFVELPSELPWLDDFDAEYFYITNLDAEVLTMNFSVHWHMANIPREDDLWRRAIVDSIYPGKQTISLDLCPEEHMASLAIPVAPRKLDQEIAYTFKAATPRTDIRESSKVLLTRVLASVFVQYKNQIVRFGREWSADSFLFRELTFALVSIASGTAKFYSFPIPQGCNPRYGCRWVCPSNHPWKSPGWLDKTWVGDSAPLLSFGSPAHRPGDPPGGSPAETIYWFEDVLVSLAEVVDAEAIADAVNWGIEQGRANFQIVVLSLFKVAFAEVSSDDGDEGTAKPVVTASEAVDLSPLLEEYCVSTHPRERPELKPGMAIQHQHGEEVLRTNCTGTARSLRGYFPGLASLVNFFSAAASRRAASKSRGRLPTELYERILDFVDCDTWKNCLVVSREFRSYCLYKYRLDNHVRIVAGPFMRAHELSFDFEDMRTGETIPVIQTYRRRYQSPDADYKWMPVIGSDRKVVMLDLNVDFKLAGDVPTWPETDSDADSGETVY